MTSALVGSAKVEVVGDLGKFAQHTDEQIKTAMRRMGVDVDEAGASITEKFGATGQRAGSAYSRALAQAARTNLVGAVEGDASRAQAADAEFEKVGRSLGTTFAHAIIGGVDTSGGGLTRTVDHEVERAGESARAKMAEQGRLAGEKFGEGTKEGMRSLSGAIVGGVGVLGAGELIKGSLEQADQLEAANIKIEGSFGESSKSVQAWAKNMANSYGLSQTAAENAAGTFGQMFHGMGIGQEEAAGMAEKLSTLTENVAKFNNADPATVQAAFQAAMRGRGKALLQLGINLDSTTLAAQALSHGIVKNTVDQTALTKAEDDYAKAQATSAATNKNANATALDRKIALDAVSAAHAKLAAVMAGSMPTLTQSQKGEAAYYAILAGTKNQENAVADSSHTLAQQKKMLGAEVQNLEASFGNVLLPVLTKVAVFMTADVVPALKDVGHWIAENKGWLEPLALALGAALIAYKGITIATSLYGSVSKGVAAVIGLFTAAQGEATLATEGTTVATTELDAAMDANPIGLVVAAIAALAVGLIYAYNHSKGFRDAIDAIGRGLKAVWTNVLQPVVQFFERNWKTAIVIAGAVLLPFIAIPLLIAKHWGAITGFLGRIWNDVWGFLKTWGPVALAVLVPFIGIPLLIFQHFHQIIGWLRGVWNTIWGDVTGFVKSVVNFIMGIPGWIANLPNKIFDVFAHVGTAMWNGIKNGLSQLADIGKNIYNDIAGAINRDLIDKIKNWHFTIGAFGVHHTFKPFGSIPEIPLLERGGDLQPGLNIVGDAGPEAIWNSGARQTVLPNASTRHIPDNGPTKQGAMTAEELAAIQALGERPIYVTLPDKRVLAQAVNEGNARNNRR